MQKKTVRFLLNLAQLIAMSAAVYTWDRNLTVHAISGALFAFLAVRHLQFNRRWFAFIGNFFREGAKNSRLKWQFYISLLSSIFWSLAILTGFLSLLAISSAVSTEQAAFVHIHGVLARLGCLIVLVHLVQHRKQINAYLKKK